MNIEHYMANITEGSLIDKLQAYADDHYCTVDHTYNEIQSIYAKRNTLLEAKERIQYLETVINKALKVAFTADMASDKYQNMYHILSRAIQT